MFSKGCLLATSDPNLAKLEIANGTKVLYVSDPGADDVRQYGFILAGPLVPPYEIISMDLNNDPNFTGAYMMYLSSEAAQQFYAVILTAIFRGMRVLLYFPEDTASFNYPKVLLNSFSNYGIIPGIPENKTYYSYMNACNDNNILFMYMMDTINYQEFILYGNIITSTAIHKLIHDAGPIVDNSRDMNSYVEWADRYKKAMLNAGRYLVKPIYVEGGCNCKC